MQRQNFWFSHDYYFEVNTYFSSKQFISNRHRQFAVQGVFEKGSFILPGFSPYVFISVNKVH